MVYRERGGLYLFRVCRKCRFSGIMYMRMPDGHPYRQDINAGTTIDRPLGF